MMNHPLITSICMISRSLTPHPPSPNKIETILHHLFLRFSNHAPNSWLVNQPPPRNKALLRSYYITIAFPNWGYVTGVGWPPMTNPNQPFPTIFRRQAARPAAYREHYDVPSRPRSAPADQDVARDWARMHCLQGTLNHLFGCKIPMCHNVFSLIFWTRSQKVFQ